jgi:hypothetical protein
MTCFYEGQVANMFFRMGTVSGIGCAKISIVPTSVISTTVCLPFTNLGARNRENRWRLKKVCKEEKSNREIFSLILWRIFKSERI